MGRFSNIIYFYCLQDSKVKDCFWEGIIKSKPIKTNEDLDNLKKRIVKTVIESDEYEDYTFINLIMTGAES